jgi:hypothetical protein
MPEQSGDVSLGLPAQVKGVGGIEKDVFPVPEQGLMHMHAAAVDAEDGLGHERGVASVPGRDLLADDAVGDGHVGHLEGFLVPQVDLVLAAGDLMMAVFDLDAHVLERADDLAPELDPQVHVGGVEIAPDIQAGRLPVRREQEELQFRPEIKRVSALGGLPEHFFEDVAAVALVGGHVRFEDVAEHPGHQVLVAAPGKDLERRGLGHGQHVRFLHPGESVDRGPVETHALGKRGGQLARRDLENF